MNIKKTEIIQTIKENYNRDLRKQVVKTMLANEKEKGKTDYQLIDQIFSYVLKELGWKMPENPNEWDYTPLDIMKAAFPNIENTKWFEVQILTAKKLIEMESKG